MRSLCGVLAVASALPGAQADWLSDLLGSALGSFGSGSGSGSDDVSLDVSVVAESDTDLNFTAAATLHAGDVDLNVTVAFAAEKCDTRNLQATVEVDMITPDVFSQGMCRLLGMGCGSSYIVTSLFEQTYAIAPPAHNVSMTVDDPLEFEVNLTPWDEDTPVSIVFSNVLPMFTGLSFTVEAHGLSTGVIRTSLSDCAMLDDVMSGLGITEADLGLDEGALCAFLGDSIDVTNDLLEELGLTTDPINVGKLIADRVDEPLAWLDEDTGTVTLGQNSDVCQITPDPFRVVFEDVGGNALDSLLANAETIVNAFVETANRCLGGGNTYEYTITAANFADISFEQDENGQWVLSGSLFGGAAKNPAGIFSCFAGDVGPIEMDDGSEVTPGDMEIEPADNECDSNPEFSQCNGPAPPPPSPMQTFETEKPGMDSDTVTIVVAVCVSAVVMVAIIAAAVVVVRKKQVAHAHYAVSKGDTGKQGDDDVVHAVVISTSDPATLKSDSA
eukprot:INCI601.2.p1 GENE.INCI601.2~~INCI601.2.p1  ORF type:complete len:501 (+),score=112.18 INCI601.2:120-1622(+)